MDVDGIQDDIISQGKAWLLNCLATHSSCAKKARHANIFCSDNSHYITDLPADGLVPSRLLSFPVIPLPKSQEDVVKLVLSQDLDDDTQYVALSHRWGPQGFPIPRTLESNLESHVRDGIVFKDLPRTYRDAIDVTRRMGYEHLWIDSLCIIQDAPSDWKKEARRMAIIYDHAIFTIAAMDAENCTQGLFPANGGEGSSLESRAWACQERIIAPRTLMFTEGAVGWECRQGTARVGSERFDDRTDGTVVGCEKDDWIPPTHPKAIFAFFRDWRLPPKVLKESESDEDVSESQDALLGIRNTITRGETDLVSPRGKDNKDTDSDRTSQDGDSVSEIDEITRDLSDLRTSSDEQNDVAEPGRPIRINTSELDNGHGRERTVGLLEEVPGSVEETNPLGFVWSDDDPPIKIWNIRPGEGESGVFVNHETNTIEVFYGKDLPAHAQHLMSQVDIPVLGVSWSTHPDDDVAGTKDPFGRFQIQVTELLRPQDAYYSFIRVWWNFLALYTPRNLTYDSDAFLAMNGVTSVAQRWSHLRNSFGLWHSFPQFELCWYINPEKPAVRPTSPSWLVPSWSWASTRGGMVQNAIWGRWPAIATLNLKPVVGSCMGTAFDMPLPLLAWRKSRYHALEVKGDLRQGIITRTQTDDGEDVFEIELEPTGRWSDYEVHRFYPDCPEDFLVDDAVKIFVLLVWHYHGSDSFPDLSHHLDIRLVLKTISTDPWISNYGPHTMPVKDAEDERTMRRLGMLETSYDLEQIRVADGIHEDFWWKFVRLV